MKLSLTTIDKLRIEDEASFRSIGHYPVFKEILRRAGYKFRCLPGGSTGRWDRALFLNLTFWGGGDGDILVDRILPADVVAHVAWHHVTRRALGKIGAARSADAMFFGEAIASAYDIYLIGRLLGRAGRSSFLETQVSGMAEAASAAGRSAREFSAMLQSVAEDPDQAFEDLRALLFSASTSLLAAQTAETAHARLCRYDRHRFAPLLLHYELSTWILYARAYAAEALLPVPKIRALDRRLRRSASSVETLMRDWCAPLAAEL